MTPALPIVWEGEGAAVVSQWFFDSGDRVAAGDVVCELTQDKAVIEVTAPAAGVIDIAARADAEVAPGTLLALVSD